MGWARLTLTPKDGFFSLLVPARRPPAARFSTPMNLLGRTLPLFLLLVAALPLSAQTPVVPDWALPGSATHHQVSPPADFRRPTTTYNLPLGLFDGQSDVGSALVPGTASYDSGTQRYTITSAGYNIWYFRDEFRFLWKKMSGDVSLAADIAFPDSAGYGDRKVVLIIRQDLDDDSKEVMVALHGAGLIHLASRATKRADITETCKVPALSSGHLAHRVGIQKHGNSFALFISKTGERMHQAGPPLELRFDEPFYVGIGFTSHQPATLDTAVVSDVQLVNAAGQVK